MANHQENVADDLLRGVPAIAEFIGESPRQTYDLLETERVPGFKLGGKIWYASKTRLRHHYARLAANPEAA
ncbi:MAG: DNA-binding protein [Xanthobacteraceae bacterium]